MSERIGRCIRGCCHTGNWIPNRNNKYPSARSNRTTFYPIRRSQLDKGSPLYRYLDRFVDRYPRSLLIVPIVNPHDLHDCTQNRSLPMANHFVDRTKESRSRIRFRDYLCTNRNSRTIVERRAVPVDSFAEANSCIYLADGRYFAQ